MRLSLPQREANGICDFSFPWFSSKEQVNSKTQKWRTPMRNTLARLLHICAFLVLVSSYSLSQGAPNTAAAVPDESPKQASASQPGASNGQAGSSNADNSKVQKTKIGATSTVKDKITVTAGLLTASSAAHLFGGWIAEHFLVVQVTIGNQSREQQFVLHDIFLDYSNWKLSGIYDTPDADQPQDTNSSQHPHQLQDYQSGTERGQISSIGALEVQEALKQNSVFSKRNFFVNGLILVGATAGGFTFLGPKGLQQGAEGYSSDFLPALQKFWPDRRIDQQSNVLKYGFQDKMVIAKEDPGKTYAFFPIERMLTKGLVRVYKDDPAVFLNMAELYLDPEVGALKHRSWRLDKRPDNRLLELRKTVDQLVGAALPTDNNPNTAKCHPRYLECKKDHHMKYGSDCSETPEFRALVLEDLFSPCYSGAHTEDNPNGENACQIEPMVRASSIKLQDAGCAKPDSNSSGSGEDQQVRNPLLTEIQSVKDIITGLSLNTVRVVVTGIMTVDVDLVPPVMTKASFDDSGKKSIFEDTTSKHTGVIEGKYLQNGKPVISGIKVPADPAGAAAEPVADYIETSSLALVPDQSTDSELHFTVQFKKPIPTGSTLTFQVQRSSSKSTTETGAANTQETTSSMKLDYAVNYSPSQPADAKKPTIASTSFDSPSDLLANTKPATGHLTGTNLKNEAIELKSIALSDGTAVAQTSIYVADKPLAPTTCSDDKAAAAKPVVKAQAPVRGGPTTVKEKKKGAKTRDAKQPAPEAPVQAAEAAAASSDEDTKLCFTLTLGKGLPPGASLVFDVKPKSGGDAVEAEKPYIVPTN
jgi:hypothetical protein